MNKPVVMHKRGSIFAAMFGAVAMMGVVGVAAMNMIGGPITTAAKVTHQNMAQNDLLMNAKVVVMNASTRPNQGDEDGDGYVEPVPFVPVTHNSCTMTLPAGSSGGCLPSDIGAILTDPWGTQYMYCVWDHGDPATSPNRITGEDSTSGAVLAIISAGPNKRFETPCRAYDGDPATNDDAINPDGNGDDLVQIYTYAAAVAGSGGLWELKENEPETAVIDKKLEIGDVSSGTGFAFDTATGQGEFPYIKTDFLASKSGGTTPVTMVNNIALDGNWLSGDGDNEGVFVDSFGRVGIGTSMPKALLHLQGANVVASGGVNGVIAENPDGGTLGSQAILRTDGGIALMRPTDASSSNVNGFVDFSASPDLYPEGRYARILWDDDKSAFRFIARDVVDSNHPVPLPVVVSIDGRVGIGIREPIGKLHVVDSGNNGLRFDTVKDHSPAPANSHDISRLTIDAAGASYPELYLRLVNSSSTTTSVLSGGDLNIGTTGPVLDISLGYSNGYVAGNPSQPNHVSRVFIDNSTGHVGIGTSTPQSNLHIASDSMVKPARIQLTTPNTGHTASDGGHIYMAGNQLQVVNQVGGPIILRNGAAVNLAVASNNNVGIGTMLPTQKLQVVGAIDVTNNRILRVATPADATDAANKSYVDLLGNRTSCTNGQLLKWNGTTWACAGDNIGMPDNFGNHTASQNINLNGRFLSGDGDNEGIFIDTDGHVYIGNEIADASTRVATTGTSLFFRGANTNSDLLRLYRYNADIDQTELRMQIGDNPSGGATQDKFVIGTAGNPSFPDSAWNPQITFTSDGFIGIGNTNPMSRIHMQGTGGGNDDIRLESYTDTATQSGAMNFIRARGTYDAPAAVQNNDRLFWLQAFGHDGTSHQAAANLVMSAANDFSTSVDGQILLYTHNAGISGLRMVVRPNGDVGINVGQDNVREKLDVNGNIFVRHKRIYFNHDGDTDTNNDYIQYFDDNNQMFTGNAGWLVLYAERDRGEQTWDTPSFSLSARGAYFERRVAIGTKTPRSDLHSANGALLGSVQIGAVAENSQVDMPWAYESISTTSTSQNLRLLSGSYMYFHTGMTASEPQDNSKARLAITNSGNIGVGVMNPSHLFHVNGIARSTQANFVTSSDMRVKTNIHGIENGLDVISRLRPVTYEYTQEYQNNNADLGGVRRGFIAQEVEEVLPDVVTRTTETVGNAVIDDFRVLKNDDFVPLLVRAVQELKAENDVLRAEIERIKSMHDQ